jgi:ABC-2 type transport system permease protein
VRQLNVWQSVDCLVGAIVLGVAVVRLQYQLGVGQALAFAAALPIGMLVLYCFWLCLATGAFWIVRLEFIVELYDGIYQAGRWPVGIYPLGLRLMLTFLVPLGIAVTVPARLITGLAGGMTLLLAAGVRRGAAHRHPLGVAARPAALRRVRLTRPCRGRRRARHPHDDGHRQDPR